MKIHRRILPPTVLLALILAGVFTWRWLDSAPQPDLPPTPPATTPPAAADTRISPATFTPSASVDVHTAEALPQPAPEPLPVSLPEEPALAMRQDLRWQAAMPEPAFAHFREWTRRFEKATP